MSLKSRRDRMARWFDLNEETEMEGERERKGGGFLGPSAWLSAGDRGGWRSRRKWPWFLYSLPPGDAPPPTHVPQVDPPPEEDDDLEYMVGRPRPPARPPARPRRPPAGPCQISIATWNSQGNPHNSPAKREVLRWLQEHCPVILLQECGRLQQENLLPGRHLYISPHAGALNNRCISAIISNGPLTRRGSGTLMSSNGRSYSYGVFRDALIVATLHANASGDAPVDGRAAATAMARLSRRFNLNFVLGGDFNAEPSRLAGRTRHIRVGSRGRGADVYVASCGSVTHIGRRGNRELDYFIYEGVTCSNTTRFHRLGGSDHYPVITVVRESRQQARPRSRGTAPAVLPHGPV
ncbi:endonuclease/exonuclease/phosphatase family protein [Sorangium sp. So ce131]|uniref:endonuclease/exonuclease/phosphatase family protein n=1 Tax=Sorangium sp. So ce131 TaxID=3133282 RepID=UPI003F5F97D2